MAFAAQVTITCRRCTIEESAHAAGVRRHSDGGDGGDVFRRAGCSRGERSMQLLFLAEDVPTGVGALGG